MHSKRSNNLNSNHTSLNHNSVEQQRIQAFKNNMREIQNNVKRTEEVLSIIQNNSRNATNNVKSPVARRGDHNGSNYRNNNNNSNSNAL